MGISAIPPIYLQVLQVLGKYIDIHLLLINPCRYYWWNISNSAVLNRWQHRSSSQQHQLPTTYQPLRHQNDQIAALLEEQGEQQIGNQLLASWGKQGRDNLYLLEQLENLVEVDAFVEPTSDCLLSILQRDILMLEDHPVINTSRRAPLAYNGSKRLLLLEDNSLSFHVCHSPQREVEVLHDNLLAMMTKDATLSPRDIIVMVTDIERYTPAIQAVFGSVDTDRYLSYTISDRNMRQIHPVLTAFLALLDLPSSRFTSEQVLALLELPELAARFDLQEKELKNSS